MVTTIGNDAHLSTGRALPHARVGAAPIFTGSAAEAVCACVAMLRECKGGRIATANLDFLAIARRDREARTLLEASNLVVADGAPVAWLASLKSRRRVERLAGVDLVEQLLASSARPLRVVMYGSDEEVSRGAAEAIRRRHAHVVVAARIVPPFRELNEHERARERETICLARPDVVLVALGFPRQEQTIAAYFDSAPRALWLGVGGTFDFFAGRRTRAPRLLQRIGLEWTVRLAQEPGRLWRRYLLRDIPEAARATAECVFFRLRTRPVHRLN